MIEEATGINEQGLYDDNELDEVWRPLNRWTGQEPPSWVRRAYEQLLRVVCEKFNFHRFL